MNKTRNLKVELLRIVSILLVIANHSVLNLYYGNPHKYLAVEAMTLMGVTIFFIITGFFLYDTTNNTQKVYRNYLLRIFIPFSIFCLIVIVFEKAITCEMSLIEVIKNIDIVASVKTYLTGLKLWTCTKWTYLLGHTWYVFDYTVIIVLFPVSYYLIHKLDKRFLYILCIIFLLYIIYVDFSVPNGLETYALSRNVPKVAFLSIFGHLFYNDFLPYLRNKLMNIINNKNKAILLFLSFLILLFIIVFNILVKVQLFYDNINNGNTHFPYYFRQESFLMILMSFLFILIFFLILDRFENCMSSKINSINKDKLSNIILFFSKKTFLVYLIHSELIVISMNTGLFEYFKNDNVLLQFILNIVYVFIIYLISVFISYLIEIIYILLFNKEKRL